MGVRNRRIEQTIRHKNCGQTNAETDRTASEAELASAATDLRNKQTEDDREN